MGLLSSILQWCLLMPKFLVLMVANLPDPTNCAHCRALYHPWHSAVRHHGHQARPLPWIALRDSFVIASYNGHMHRLPENAMTAGSTNDWLALGLGQKHTNEDQAEYYVVRNYVLHNPFSYRALPLPELQSPPPSATMSCTIRFHTGEVSCPQVPHALDGRRFHRRHHQQQEASAHCIPARERCVDARAMGWATQYTYLIDIAFHGDKLYAITTAEDLIPIDLALDGEGRPMVAMGPRVIKKSINYDYYESLTTSDEEDDDENEEDGEEEDNDDEKKEEEEDNDLTYINCSAEFAPEVKLDNITIISRHLIESHGKLLMINITFMCISFAFRMKAPFKLPEGIRGTTTEKVRAKLSKLEKLYGLDRFQRDGLLSTHGISYLLARLSDCIVAGTREFELHYNFLTLPLVQGYNNDIGWCTEYNNNGASHVKSGHSAMECCYRFTDNYLPDEKTSGNAATPPESRQGSNFQ
uniref:KIB1-4 beta-propeller domain-containing protein n=1 Tax=Aegilops tauschii TaxID=37682 RepID=M8CIV4_AEGTA